MSHPAHVADTIPYPWPYNGCVAAEHLALVICGAQRQLVDSSTDAVGVRHRLELTAEAVRSGGGRIIWIRHGTRRTRSRPNQFLPMRTTSGWQILAAVSREDEVIDSAGWDGCFGSGLDHYLQSGGFQTVIMGGFASEITVDSTVRTLNDRGHECLVLTDGCAPVNVELGARTHASLTMSGGIFGALGTTTSVLNLLDQLSNNITHKETSA